MIRFTDAGDEQSLKTQASNRLVPVHPDLVNLGLLRYVDSQKTAQRARLFHMLTADKHGLSSASWSKWWGRYARGLGITDPRKVFHSFRHLFKHVMRRNGVDDKVSKAIMGHTLGEVADDYGSEDYPLPPKVAAMSKLKFPALEIPTLV